MNFWEEKYMEQSKFKKIRFCYGIYLSLYTVLMGILLIVQAVDIYETGVASGGDIYTREIVAEHLAKIVIPAILYGISAAVGFVLSQMNLETKKLKAETDPKKSLEKLEGRLPESAFAKYDDEWVRVIQKERHNRKAVWGVVFGVCAVCATVCLCYLLMPGRFDKSGNLMQQAGSMMLFLLPFLAVSFGLNVFGVVYEGISIERQTAATKELIRKNAKNLVKTEKTTAKKESNTLFFVRCGLFVLAVVLIVLGILNGGMRDVLIKAINICTECIGLG